MSTEKPPPPREGRLAGLMNQGSTCYLNSVLQVCNFTTHFCPLTLLRRREWNDAAADLVCFYAQTCFMTPELRDAIFAVSPEEIGYDGPLRPEGGLDADTKGKILFMPCEIQRLFAYMQVSSMSSFLR